MKLTTGALSLQWRLGSLLPDLAKYQNKQYAHNDLGMMTPMEEDVCSLVCLFNIQRKAVCYMLCQIVYEIKMLEFWYGG